MKYFKAKALAGVVGLSFALVSNPAAAIIPVTDVAAIIAIETVTSAVGTASGAISQAIATSATTITGADQTNTQNIINAIGSMSTRVEGQVKAGYESNIDMINGARDVAKDQDDYRKQKEIMVQKASGMRGAPCEDFTATAAAAMGRAGRKAAGGGGIINREVVQRLTSSISPQAAAVLRAKVHEDKYCGPAGSNNNQCTPAPADYQNADQSSATLFTGASSTGTVYLTYDAERLAAAKAYTANIIKPIPSPRLDPDTEKTPQGKAYMALHRSETAKLALAAKASSDYIASVDPENAKINGKPLGAVLKEMWAAQGFEPDPNMKVGNEISFREMAEIEATRRYASQNWYKNIAKASDTNILLKEMAYMQALEINQRHQQMKQMENLLAVNSGIYHELIEMNSGPKLAAQRDAAIKSAR